jgi:HD-GYP domain-containing protein (c-di-GMP phosphodiesterase class II)
MLTSRERLYIPGDLRDNIPDADAPRLARGRAGKILHTEGLDILALSNGSFPTLRAAGTGLRVYRSSVRLAALLLAVLVLLQHQALTLPVRDQVIGLAGQLAVFLALAILAESVSLRMPDYGRIPVAISVYFALLILYGPAPSLLILFIAGLVRAVRLARAAQEEPAGPAFTHTFIAFGAGSIVYYFLSAQGDFFASPASMVQNTVALACAALVCFAGDTLFSSLFKSLETGTGLYPQMIDMRRLKVFLLMLAPLGLLIATLFQIGPWGLVFLVPPMIVVIRSIKSYTDVLVEARYTIESLSQAVESRDPYTINHSDRVARYCEDIARELRLSEETIEHIVSAAKLHDLGKISVADEILGKMESLTEDEFEEIKRHPTVGGEVAGHLSLCREAAVIIAQHHERWDGKGYPAALAGVKIHRGARILAVAEAFDSMTTPRSYKDAIPAEEAVRILRDERGRQFDPFIVDAFVEVWNRKESWTGKEAKAGEEKA